MSEKSNSTTTVIGPTIVIRGKLKSDEDLVVRGRIDAEISSTKSLFVENSGIVKANMRVDAAHISGVVVGNVVAGNRVEIHSDGRMVGDLLAPRIVISDGAAFKGKIDMQNFDEPRLQVPDEEGRPARAWTPPPLPTPEAVEPLAALGGNDLSDGVDGTAEAMSLSPGEGTVKEQPRSGKRKRW